MKLEISYPVKPILINQRFGNKDQKYTSLGLPGHNGIDFDTRHGQPVYATHSGFASFQVDDKGGHGVVIITDKEYQSIKGVSSYWKTIYWHLCDGLKEPKFASPFQGKTGFTRVNHGDIIGYADNTGFSTGDHLHFALKPVAKGEDWGTWYNLEQTNGYNGAVDPEPYFDKSYAEDVVILKEKISLLQKLINVYKRLILQK